MKLTWSPSSTVPSKAIAILLVVSALFGCGDNQDEPGAVELLQRIRDESYRSWQRAPGWESRRPTSAPHGEAVDVYVNDIVVEVLDGSDGAMSWPTGSIIAKDGWDGSDLEIIAVMEKRDDGWFWAEYDGGGEVCFSGRPGVCLDCHGSGSDYVRAFTLP
ncbi:MAG TPA: hypothetical protein VF989_18125 [Polyangiaceae bacterium]|jgi:hypothetical protein